ncbi:MAG: sulfite exporter TauE/SafE family protein [Erythrobacter sp.]|nr:sulfite exporter TauE/SafE family protein [Erythrobacter sp.]NCQ65121.1 sulfite exporter TauE/SafE family protein [Alphaproteobacteria bacterium]
MDITTIALTLLSGGVIGFVLGLVGGGGSILAVPLLVYAVGMKSPHMAIGTAAVAVALNALVGLVGHARSGNVRWQCAISFAIAGSAGAALGAEAGKAFDGEKLLGLFGGLMVVVAVLMLLKRRTAENPQVSMTRGNARSMLTRILPTGLGTGLLAGFFGIGGGFLIVPGLVFATAMPLSLAIGSSLVAVTAFGMTTAGSYALSGLVDWTVVSWLVAGGVGGSVLGRAAGARLAGHKRVLEVGFAVLVAAVGLWVIAGSLGLQGG